MTLTQLATLVNNTRFPGLSVSTLVAEAITIHRMILNKLPHLRQNALDPLVIALANNTSSYDLPPNILQVSQVFLANGGVVTPLVPSTYFGMLKGKTTTSFAQGAAGAVADVKEYCVIGTKEGADGSGRRIVLNVAPSDGNGKSLQVYGAEITASPSGSTDLFECSNGELPYIEGLSWRAALIHEPNVAAAYFQSFMSALEIEADLRRTEIENLGTNPMDNVRLK